MELPVKQGSRSFRVAAWLRPICASLGLVVVFSAAFLGGQNSYATDRYVSPAGTDTGTCSNIASPCKTPTYCYRQMAAGDTCNLRTGVYTAPVGGFVFGGPSETYRCTAAAPCLIRGYASEVAELKPSSVNDTEGTVKLLPGAATNPPGSGASYLGFAYLTIWGRITLCSGNDCSGNSSNAIQGFQLHHNTIKCLTASLNCQNNGHIYTQRDDSMRVGGGHIYENTFIEDATCDYSWFTPDDSVLPCHSNEHNAQMTLYSTVNWVIENNDFRIAATRNESTIKPSYLGRPTFEIETIFWFKERDGNAQVRYNYIEDNRHTVSAFKPGTGQNYKGSYPYGGNNSWYQNVVNGAASLAYFWCDDCDSEKVYNNTFYNGVGNPTNFIDRGDDPTWNYFSNGEIFNNVGVGHFQRWMYWNEPSGSHFPIYGNVTGDPASTNNLIYYNNNVYFDPANPSGSGGTMGLWREFDATSFGSLATWTAHLVARGYPAASTENRSKWADPLFVNAGAGDFHLQATSPARSGGRGGSYSTVMGAYITGSEVIGCTFNTVCKSYSGAPAAVPSTVTGVTRTDTH